MDENQKKKIHKRITLASIGLLAAAVAFMGVCVLLNWVNNSVYNLTLIVFLMVYCYLTDYLEPKLCGAFVQLTPKQRAEFNRFAALDIFGYVGLAVFFIGLTGGYSGAVMGLIIFAFTIKPKNAALRRFREERKKEEPNRVRR